MAKEFNTEVTCDPKLHYMVDTTNKMKVFERLIDRKKYFTINRARQFGKSTSLKWIYTHLNGEYLVVSLSFEDTEETDWENASTFYHFFCRYMVKAFESGRTQNEQNAKFWVDAQKVVNPGIKDLSDKITEFCQNDTKKVVVLIDEVDKSLDNELFLNFLSMLRKKYIDRDQFGDYSTFWSVILAGVYDIKSMKVKIRPEEEHKFNSPWNVAANYKLDMSFNPQEISTMLVDYESENHIGFDINEISQEIYKYTSGYPVLVSAVCKEIDENLDRDWTKEGVLAAVNNLIKDNSAMLFKDITKNIENNPDLKKLLRAISLENFKISYYADIFPVELGRLFSLLKADKHSCAQIHNLIFQQRINNYFIAENQFGRIESNAGPSVYTDKQGDLNMPLIINRFKDVMKRRKDINASEDGQPTFLEREGRFMFICFLKPILNGSGFYYIEPENDDGSRMDLVITFNHKEYVVELKIWHGTEYELSGRDQLSEYLETRNLNEGFLVTFSFLKEKVVQEKPEWIQYNGKRIYEAVI
ncbi:MAG: AAA-like domain-containing protein [Bacteroidales bacterium]|nr:AAA-like domain-containing protein [Bacteroidales bacterium]